MRDNNFLFLGTSHDTNVMANKSIIIKTDSNGDVLWSREFGIAGDFNDYHTYAELVDGNIIFADQSGLLLKTNAFGDSLWTLKYNDFNVTSLKQTLDSELFITGDKNSTKAYFKTDSVGNILWSKHIYSTYNEQIFNGVQTPDGGYFLSGIYGSMAHSFFCG